MIIGHFRLWRHVVFLPELVDEYEELFKDKFIVPVKSFGQYIALLDNTHQVEYKESVAKYYGTDIAKYIGSINATEKILNRDSFLSTVKSYIEYRTKSKLVESEQNCVMLINAATKKILLTFPKTSLEDYQQREDDFQAYISRFDTFLVTMTMAKSLDIAKLSSSLLQ